MHSPIWSAFDNHYLPVGIPKRFSRNDLASELIVGRWGHLLQSRQQTSRDISTRVDREFA